MRSIAAVKDLRLTFPGSGKLLFRDVSVQINEGEKVLILGPSGSGKSTLLQVLTGLIPQVIQLPLTFHELDQPQSWGYVFQDPDSQFCMPYVDEELAFVLENLGVPRKEMDQLIEDYLKQVGLTFEDNHLPINQLSQGMKQRLAVASVLALNPDMLVLDEPSAMLDPKGTEQIWQTIRSVANDKTVVIVEHKIDYVLDFVERVIVLDVDGQVMADGPTHYVFNHYKEQLREYGIWFPGVWEEYVSLRLWSNEPRAYELEKPLVELQDFSVLRYRKQTLVSVDEAVVYPGEWICITGENGAGKSTLLLGLMNILKTKGHYTFLQQQVKPKEMMSKDIGYVFQNPEHQFITNDVYSEVAFNLTQNQHQNDEVKQTVERCLALFSLTGQKDQHPYQLSMGQKRRLSVATALVKNQKVVLLDEPTFGQDAKSTFALLEMIEGCKNQGITVIMVTHDDEIVKHFASREWKVKHGKVYEDVSVTSKKKVSP